MASLEESKKSLQDAIAGISTAPLIKREGPRNTVQALPYGGEIINAARRHGLAPELLAGLVKVESGFNPKAGSGAGAVGLTQLMPATAASLGVTDRTDPEQSLDGGARYLAQQFKTFGGITDLALAAYNAGPGAVQKAGNKVPRYPETIAYVKRVKAYAKRYGWKGGTGVVEKDSQGGIVGDVIGAVGDTATDVVGGIDALANGVEDVVSALFNPSTYLRAGKGILGVLLLLLGAWALFSAYGGKIPVGPKVPVPK